MLGATEPLLTRTVSQHRGARARFVFEGVISSPEMLASPKEGEAGSPYRLQAS